MASRAPPSEEEISQVIDFAGLNPHDDRIMVIQALKENGRNVEAVVMQYFDNPESVCKSKHSKSPTDAVGLAASIGPSREDEDMQRALRESAQEAGIGLLDQHTGVMDASTSSLPTFGPANRDEYDQESWAMVPSAPPESRAPTAPPPSRRKRTPGAPAFLIQGVSSVGNHGLGGMLTVLHEIPLARNALLEVGAPAASYGFNSEWWKGQEILPPHVLARLQAGDLQWGQQSEAKPDMEEEIHRLMAFLDSTDRSYGSVSVLTDLLPCPSLGPEKQLYEYLGPRNEEKLKPLIHSAVLAPVIGDELGDEEARFGLLEMEHLRGDYSYIKTMYESLDHTMWSDAFSYNEIHEGSKMAMFKDMGEVLAIKLNGDGPEDSIDIPEKLYLEKYQTNRKDEARRIQAAWCETKSAIADIAKQEQKLYEWRNDWNDDVFDRKQMIQRAIGQWQAYRDYLQSLGRFRQMEASGFDTDKYPDYRMAPCVIPEDMEERCRTVEDTLQLNERMLGDMEAKMKELTAQQEQIKVRQRFLGQLLTQPDKAGRPRPMTCKEFLLRGVVTQSDMVYVCQRAEPDLIELGNQARGKECDQWWRLAYNANDGQEVKTEVRTMPRTGRRG
ncbi:hypothetical protein UVI_02011750 [Ustilaginoidea virens]|uniref:Ubiquitin interaction domain-containing protein n=1 Tax=Ustilaginoidea virens TaxID=1159556 RepID=A0A1B5L357_USTVR|nr:hypothetical protein UVI_02011750 [Ustilaginoidea virens]